MMTNIIFIDFNIKKLLPFTYTRSILDIRIGITTIKEKWEILGLNNFSIITQEQYYNTKANLNSCTDELVINSAIIPDKFLLDEIFSLKNQKLVKNSMLIAWHKDKKNNIENISTKQYKENLLILNKISDIFLLNHICIENDFKLITKNRQSQLLSKTNSCFGHHPIFMEEGACVECTTLNSEEGVIYIGKDARIMEGSNIRGPFALCNNAEIKMGSKIYSGTTIGPFSKVGGEINNSVIFAYSNKAHDGFLGNSVIGEWCNLGAGTNNSNLKNNYSNVKLWDFENNTYKTTNLLFCGLFMGDHSKSAIGTKFNTGTIVGVASNIALSNFPPKLIPSFSWLTEDSIEEYSFNKAINTMEKVMKRRNILLTEKQINIYKDIFINTKREQNK